MNWKWHLKDIKQKNNYSVFGTFLCGGGSTMGYKMAGFKHLGGVEIDKKLAEIYKTNHNPKYFYNMDIREFNKMNDFPKELYTLDILDGSPPCSSFSMAGNREKKWGEKKLFKEGQAKQILDDLVFVYCETINKLKPKVFILENVKGLISGNAKAYCKKIIDKLNDYNVQVFLLDASKMGVPQRRQRVFFIGHKKEYNIPKLILNFNEKPIFFKDIRTQNGSSKKITDTIKNLLLKANKNDKCLADINNNKNTMFSCKIMNENIVTNTVTASGKDYRFCDKKECSDFDYINRSTFPQDYNFLNTDIKYVVGMSVPPIMMEKIATQIKIQWLDKISSN